MRYFRIILLHIQPVFEQRMRSLVWFFIPAINCLTLILFWKGSLKANNFGITMSGITTYYFLLTFVSAFIHSHSEYDIAEEDIKQGFLTRYLTRPFSYYWLKLAEELPYRWLQGSYGVVLMGIFYLIFGSFIVLDLSFINILLSVIIIIFAVFLSYTYKMNLGLVAFWLKDNRGFYQLLEIVVIILNGSIMPLSLYSSSLQSIAFALPYAYITYIPVISLQGKLTLFAQLGAIGWQIIWLLILIAINRLLWFRGLRQFTAVGQ